MKVAYHCLSEAEHAWHYIRPRLDASRAEVDKHIHVIIDLEHANEQ
jgi:hypothetical protein